MTIEYKILVGNKLNREESKKLSEIVQGTFLEIDQIYNKWNPNSELSRLNQARANEQIPLSKSLEVFLIKTADYVAMTDGKFDPTVESAQKVWKKAFQQGTVPTTTESAKAVKAIGWNKVHVEKGFFWKEDDLLEIDLGGIAKGYTIDLITERLNQAGFPDVYVEWGGEIRTSGRHPEGRPWRVGINGMDEVLDLENAAVASSGDYLQNWTINGTTYFHVFDPLTGLPLIVTDSSVASATVVAETCLLADVLATAAMQCETCEEAKIWLDSLQLPHLKYWMQ